MQSVRMLLAALAAVAISFAGAPRFAAAQEASLGPAVSLDEAVNLAHQYNPNYRIQAADLEALGWREREAWAGFMPTASVSNTFGYTAGGERQFGDFTLGTQPAQLTSRYSLSLQLSVNGSTFLRPGVVGSQEAATRARVVGASASLVDQVTQAYLSALRADEQLQQAQAEVERTTAYVTQAQAQVAAGAATPLDIRRAETSQGQAEVQLLQAENAVITSRLSLAEAIGVTVTPGVDLTTTFQMFEPDLDIEALVQLALEQNPTLRAARSQESALHSQTRMAQTGYLPNLNLSASWSGSVFQADGIGPLVESQLAQTQGRYGSCLQNNRILELLGDPLTNCGIFDVSDPAVEAGIRESVRQSNQGFPFNYERQPLSLSATVSIPIFNGFSRELQVQEAHVAEANARRQVTAEQLRIRTQVETSIRNVQTAARTAEIQARIRETSAEELRLAQERFRLGLAISIEVVDAQANLSQAERNEINAMYDFHSSFSGLESLVGVPLRD